MLDLVNVRTLKTIVAILYHVITLTQSKILRLPECNKFDVQFSVTYNSFRLAGSVLTTLHFDHAIECVQLCVKYQECETINVNPGKKICEINKHTKGASNSSLEATDGWVYMDTPTKSKNLGPRCNMERPCLNNGMCEDTCDILGYKCICLGENFGGQHCERAVENIALHQVTSQSSTWATLYSKNAVDGKIEGVSAHTGVKKELNWWQVHFPRMASILKVVIFAVQDNTGYQSWLLNARLTASNSSTFDNEKFCAQVSTVAPIHELRCAGRPVVAQYLRISKSNEMIVLKEVLVHGWLL